MLSSQCSSVQEPRPHEPAIGEEAVITDDSLGVKDKDVDFNAYLDADKANDSTAKLNLSLAHRVHVLKAGERVLVIGSSGYPIPAKQVRPTGGEWQSETFWVDAKRLGSTR